MNIDHLEIAYKKEQIEEKIKAKAEEINQVYKDKDPIVVGCLIGCFMFFSDFVRHLKIKTKIDFLKVSSYHQNKQSNSVEISGHFKYSLEDKDIIIIEDICDTGKSLNTVIDLVKK